MQRSCLHLGCPSTTTTTIRYGLLICAHRYHLGLISSRKDTGPSLSWKSTIPVVAASNLRKGSLLLAVHLLLRHRPSASETVLLVVSGDYCPPQHQDCMA